MGKTKALVEAKQPVLMPDTYKASEELKNNPQLWTPGQEYDFGDGIYGVKLTITNNSSSDTTVDLSKYNVSEVEKLKVKQL